MMTVAKMINNLEALKAEQNQIIAASIKENEDDITSLTKVRLSETSATSSGGDTPLYANYTLFVKSTFGGARAAGFPRLNNTDSYTMNDTGDFYDGMELKTASESFSTTSTVSYLDDIKETYEKKGGVFENEVFGYPEEDIDTIRFIVFPTLRTKVISVLMRE